MGTGGIGAAAAPRGPGRRSAGQSGGRHPTGCRRRRSGSSLPRRPPAGHAAWVAPDARLRPSTRTATAVMFPTMVRTGKDRGAGGRMRAVVVGSLNMDLVLGVPELPSRGQTLLSRSRDRSPGGKGANQASALGRLGAGVEMVGAVGDDADGAELVIALAAAGVSTRHVSKRAQEHTGWWSSASPPRATTRSWSPPGQRHAAPRRCRGRRPGIRRCRSAAPAARDPAGDCPGSRGGWPPGRGIGGPERRPGQGHGSRPARAGGRAGRQRR
jgi:pfkB family carbohydrate kinase